MGRGERTSCWKLGRCIIARSRSHAVAFVAADLGGTRSAVRSHRVGGRRRGAGVSGIRPRAARRRRAQSAPGPPPPPGGRMRRRGRRRAACSVRRRSRPRRREREREVEIVAVPMRSAATRGTDTKDRRADHAQKRGDHERSGPVGTTNVSAWNGPAPSRQSSGRRPQRPRRPIQGGSAATIACRRRTLAATTRAKRDAAAPPAPRCRPDRRAGGEEEHHAAATIMSCRSRNWRFAAAQVTVSSGRGGGVRRRVADEAEAGERRQCETAATTKMEAGAR